MIGCEGSVSCETCTVGALVTACVVAGVIISSTAATAANEGLAVTDATADTLPVAPATVLPTAEVTPSKSRGDGSGRHAAAALLEVAVVSIVLLCKGERFNIMQVARQQIVFKTVACGWAWHFLSTCQSTVCVE